jgi:hypothetical protein
VRTSIKYEQNKEGVYFNNLNSIYQNSVNKKETPFSHFAHFCKKVRMAERMMLVITPASMWFPMNKYSLA